MNTIYQYLRDLWKRKDLLWYLVTSGLKADTRNTFLGYFWWLLDPALYVAVFAFVRVILIGRTGEDLVAFLAVGLVVFQNFAGSLTGCAGSISGKAGIITQVYLPKAMFPFGVVLTQLINFAFGLVVVAIILVFSGIIPGRELVWLPYLIVVQLVFHVAIGLVMAYAAAFVKDLKRVLGYITRVLRFTSPILWEVERVPENVEWILDYNPLAWLVIAYRDVLMYGNTPDVQRVSFLGGGALLVTVILLVFYAYNEHRIIKVL